MSRFIEIASYVVLPLVFGLAVEFAFEWRRRRRTMACKEEPKLKNE